MGTIMNRWSTGCTDSRLRALRCAYAIGICSFALMVGTSSAQIGSQALETEAPNSADTAGNTDDAHAKWTESMGEPTMYVKYARADVDQRHYKSAARNVRKAAAILSEKLHDAHGLDRRRLVQDIAALRLTARDVGAGAITSPAQLDSVLDVTHAHLRERGTAPQ